MPARSPAVVGTREKTEVRACRTSRGLDAVSRRDSRHWGWARWLRRWLRWPRWLGRTHAFFFTGVLLFLWWALWRLWSVWGDSTPDSATEVLRYRLEDALKRRRFESSGGRSKNSSELHSGTTPKSDDGFPVASDDRHSDGREIPMSNKAAAASTGGVRSLQFGNAFAERPGRAPKLFTGQPPPANATFVEETVERARRLNSPFLKDYLKALEAGLARELMPDPFAYAIVDELAGDLVAGEQFGWSLEDTGREVSEDRVASVACTFQEGVDYAGEDAGSQEGMTQNACCELCVQRNRQWEGACQVAVLSSRFDNPPKACWLKKGITKSVHKPGVMACVPTENLDTISLLAGDSSQPLLPALSDPGRFLDARAKIPGQRGTCDYQEGIDYTGEDGSSVEGMTRSSCCELCVMRNRRLPGSCKVAVLSSSRDDPPLTCWVKKTKVKSVPKPGVVSCIPRDPGGSL